MLIICELFSLQPHEIKEQNSNFLSDVLNKHIYHESVMKIIENHTNNITFNFNKWSQTTYINYYINKCYYNVLPKLVKLYVVELSETLKELVNQAFINNRFPEYMKQAEISPRFEKNDDMIKDNYTSISILAVIETIIAEKHMEYFKSILNEMLYAYRNKYGTEHVLIKLINSWKFTVYENRYEDTVLMDLSKAFGYVLYALLIAKIYVYGLSTKCLWISVQLYKWKIPKGEDLECKTFMDATAKRNSTRLQSWSFSLQCIYE